jgi:hypothetical protein
VHLGRSDILLFDLYLASFSGFNLKNLNKDKYEMNLSIGNPFQFFFPCLSSKLARLST